MQKAQKRCFRIFENFVQSFSKNVKETLFSFTFCGTSCKKLKKTLYFRIFENFVQNSRKTLYKDKQTKQTLYKVLEKCEETLFSHTFRKTSRRNLKNAAFIAFNANLVKVSRKRDKSIVYSHYLRYTVRKPQKTLVFRILSELCTKCLEKR